MLYDRFVYWIKPRMVYIALSIWLWKVKKELYHYNTPVSGVAFLKNLEKECDLKNYVWMWGHVWNCPACFKIYKRYKRLYRYTNFICRNH